MPSRQPIFFSRSTTEFPIFERIFMSSIDMNFPSFFASSIPSAATVPKPGTLFSGGRIPVFFYLEFCGV